MQNKWPSESEFNKKPTKDAEKQNNAERRRTKEHEENNPRKKDNKKADREDKKRREGKAGEKEEKAQKSSNSMQVIWNSIGFGKAALAACKCRKTPTEEY